MELQNRKIDLGCGKDNIDGYLHLDRRFHSPHIDLARCSGVMYLICDIISYD